MVGYPKEGTTIAIELAVVITLDILKYSNGLAAISV
jgi:hypothetical protein